MTIALDEDQIDELGLAKAPMPAKKREKYPWWPHDWTVELEAVSPVDLAAIVIEAIESRTDAGYPAGRDRAGGRGTRRPDAAARGGRHAVTGTTNTTTRGASAPLGGLELERHRPAVSPVPRRRALRAVLAQGRTSWRA